MQKISGVARSLMGCTGISLGESLGFLRSLSQDQVRWLNECSMDTDAHADACLELMESMTIMAATQPQSVPGKLINNIYK
jgi:hypothetical protein